MGQSGTNGVRIGWGDKSLAMFGRDVVLTIFILAIGAIIFWSMSIRKEEHRGIQEVLDVRLKENVEKQEDIVEQLEITNYFLSLSEHEKRKKLALPKALRGKD